MGVIKNDTVLDKIINYKQNQELPKIKAETSLNQLKDSEFFDRKTYSFSASLTQDNLGIIAEFKRKSPSKGMINETENAVGICKGYQDAGAVAVSILTDEQFFSGNIKYIQEARKVLNIPILRKDFIFDDYQVYEAKSIGADAILLIAAVLPPERVRELNNLAHSLGLETLLEIHDREELESCEDIEVDVIGINNRNLRTFETTLDHSKDLGPLLPKHRIRIAESGIHRAEDVKMLREYDFHGFLIGEAFMKTVNPGEACSNFIKGYKYKD